MSSNLNPVSEYITRFQNNDFAKIPKRSEFFTQLEADSYIFDLPYIFAIENFCLRLLLALTEGHKICIYADFDTDAVTATAVVYQGLIDLGFQAEHLFFYTPDRFTEGYGINGQAISTLAEEFDLIVSVDCGINSVQEAQILTDKRCDLIITDHHHLSGQIPDCVAVCNPRLSEYYILRPEQCQKIDLQAQTLIEKLKNQPTLDHVKKYLDWLNKLQVHRDKLLKGELVHSDFLSSSVTGVGVAWFCLVWLAYFMDDVNI